MKRRQEIKRAKRAVLCLWLSWQPQPEVVPPSVLSSPYHRRVRARVRRAR